jgi:hypothetical protein
MLPDFTEMLKQARQVNSKYALAAFGVIAVIAIVILLLGRLKITTFDALQTLLLIGMLLLALIILVIFGPKENHPNKTESIEKQIKTKPIGNPKQGKLGILIDLSHRQDEWQQSKEKGSIFELMESPQLKSLITPPEKMEIKWDIQGIKEKDQFSSEDLKNWNGMIFGIPKDTKISQNVCNAIVKWVHHGGRLILLGYRLGDRHHGANLNQLAQKFGIWFNSDIVAPKTWKLSNVDPEGIIELNDIQTHHMILTEVQNLIFRKICTLTVEPGACTILTVGNNRICKWLNAVYDKKGKSSFGGNKKFDILEQKQAPWVPILAEAPHSLTGEGRVLAIGTWNFFDNDKSLKDETVHNYRFVKNLLEWLSESPT